MKIELHLKLKQDIETMKLLGSTQNKITEDKNSKNSPHLETIEVVLVHCNIVNNDYQLESIVIAHLVVYQKFLQQILSF